MTIGSFAKSFWVGAQALLILSASVSAVAFADTQTTILTVETDAYEGTSFIDIVRTDQGSIKAMVYRPFGHPTEILSLDQLKLPNVLKRVSDRDIVLLSVEPAFSAEKGGYATIRFLNSGISGTYRNFRILIENQKEVILRSDPDRNDPETDDNSYTSVFNYLFLKKNTFFGKLIGIDEVEPSMR